MEHREHRERVSKNLYKSRLFVFSVLFLSKIDWGTILKKHQKYFKNFSKTY
jgi:hypothetical protein